MLLVRRKPDDIARPDLLDRPALALRPTKAGDNNQSLTKGMRMPCGASTGSKRHVRATDTCRFSRFEQRIDAHSSCEPISGSFNGTLGTESFDFHFLTSSSFVTHYRLSAAIPRRRVVWAI